MRMSAQKCHRYAVIASAPPAMTVLQTRGFSSHLEARLRNSSNTPACAIPNVTSTTVGGVRFDSVSPGNDTIEVPYGPSHMSSAVADTPSPSIHAPRRRTPKRSATPSA